MVYKAETPKNSVSYSAVNFENTFEGTSDALLGYFAPGPAKIPEEVMQEARKDLFFNYQNSAIGVLELSHRSPEYQVINEDAISCIRRTFNVPGNYRIILTPGGGVGQFCAIALNLLPEGGTADYVVTGYWSEKAAKQAAKYGNINMIYATDASSISDQTTWNRSENASYLYYCDNETIDGLEFHFVPENGGKYSQVPLVVDMSSNIGTRPMDISKFGMIFGVTSKTLGAAGCTVVIIREDLVGKARAYCPSVLDYRELDKANSVLNTPATSSVYIMKLVLEWIEKNGGLEEMSRLTDLKAQMIYDIIGQSDGFYTCSVLKSYRSRCNIVFQIKGGDEELEEEFLAAAEKINLLALRGNETVGHLRASIYLATGVPEVKKLAKFMEDFSRSCVVD